MDHKDTLRSTRQATKSPCRRHDEKKAQLRETKTQTAYKQPATQQVQTSCLREGQQRIHSLARVPLPDVGGGVRVSHLKEGIDLHVGGGQPGLLITSETVGVDLAPLAGDGGRQQGCYDERREVLEVVFQAGVREGGEGASRGRRIRSEMSWVPPLIEKVDVLTFLMRRSSRSLDHLRLNDKPCLQKRNRMATGGKALAPKSKAFVGTNKK